MIIAALPVRNYSSKITEVQTRIDISVYPYQYHDNNFIKNGYRMYANLQEVR
jgi:hypothetical protein